MYGWKHALFVLAGILLATSTAAGEEGPITKSLAIESDPPGAEVFFKQGTKEVPVGKTPLTYQAEFHSKISILRMGFKKKGFEPLTLEVSAAQDRVQAVLKAVTLVESPTVHQDPALKALQERLNPILLKNLPNALETEGPFALDMGAPLRVADLDGEHALLITFFLHDASALPKGGGKERQQALLKMLWGHVSKTFLVPLAASLQGEKDLDSFLVQVLFNEQQIIFGVGVKTQSNVSVRCVPEMQGQYNLYGKYVMVYNPCARLERVVTTELKADPKTKTLQGEARAQYAVPLALLAKPEAPDALYDRIGVLLIDAKGETVERHGAMQESLLALHHASEAAPSGGGFSPRLQKALKAAGFEFKEKEGEEPGARERRLHAIASALLQAKDIDTLVLLLTEITDRQMKAAGGGKVDPWASAYLGKLYLEGKLIPVDFEKAASLIRLAAEARDAESQYKLAELYVDGLGVEKNSGEALFWLEAAAKQGHQQAKAWLDRAKKSHAEREGK